MGLHGHGTRERQVLGPIDPNAKPTMVLILVRRYLCTACGAVPVVVPREVRAKRLYSASAIGIGLALWGLMKLKATDVRQRINPAKVVGVADDWATVRRWTKNVAARKLFVDLQQPPIDSKLRIVAARAATTLAGYADAATRNLPLEHRAFIGAAHVA
jgi:hypothetical protein